MLAGRGGWALFVLCKLLHVALVLVVPPDPVATCTASVGAGCCWLTRSKMFASLLVVFLLLGTTGLGRVYPAPAGVPHG